MIAIYPNTYSKDFSVISPESVIMSIANGQWADDIAYLRSIGKNEYKVEKKKLPGVTWSGTFTPGTRTIETIKTYSSLVCLDIDDLDSSAVNLLKSQLSEDPYVKYCFVSPSGLGLKVIVQVDVSDPKDHRSAFLHLQHEFQQKYPIKIDSSGKDVSRLCYISHDPQTIIKQSEVFKVDHKYGEVITQHRPTADGMKATHDAKKIFEVCKKWVDRNKTYRDGEKNVYLHAMACALNRCGVDIDTTIQLLNENFVTPDNIWHQSVRSAYFHNQHEHGTVHVREVGGTDFQAAPYVANFTDDVVLDDIMRTTAMLHHHKIPQSLIFDYVNKLAKYYHKMGFLDLARCDLQGAMKYAIDALNKNILDATASTALKYTVAEDLANEFINLDTEGVMPTHFQWMDEAMGGGLQPGNVYGVIGFGGTFKSILTQFWTFKDAMNDVPVLYLNGEMSKMQFYERLAIQSLNVNLRAAIGKKELNENTIVSFVEQIKNFTKGNIFVYNGAGFTKQNILATVDHIFATTGKKIKKIIADGLTQFDWLGREEAPANIYNSIMLKEIAKEANGGEGATVVSIIHCSGEENKVIRNTGTRVRGGSKVLTNLDGYFCCSLLIDPESVSIENPEDVGYLPGKFYLRMIDKRSLAGVVSCIVNVDKQILLSQEMSDPAQYEFNPKRIKQHQ